MEENTPTPTNGNTQRKKTRKPKRTFSEKDALHLIDVIASVPKRRKTYTDSQLIARIRMAIYAGVQEGRPIDEIYMAVAPLIGINRKSFDAALGDDILKAISAIEAKRAIDTTASETRIDTTPTASTKALTRPDDDLDADDALGSASASATIKPATRPASAPATRTAGLSATL